MSAIPLGNLACSLGESNVSYGTGETEVLLGVNRFSVFVETRC